MDVIEDGVNGILVQVNDTNALAEKIAKALSQPEKREQFEEVILSLTIHCDKTIFRSLLL